MNISPHGIAFGSRVSLNRPRFGAEHDPDSGTLINMQNEIATTLRNQPDIDPHVKVVRSQKDDKLIRILIKGTDPDDFRFILTKIKLRLFRSMNGLLQPASYNPPQTDILRYDNDGNWPQRARVKIVAVDDVNNDPEDDLKP